MNVLIVYAHPEPQSFNAAMKDLAIDVLRGAGHQVQVSDLYAMNFQPAGGPADFVERRDGSVFQYQAEQIHASATGGFESQLKAEMDKVLWAGMLIFQFPMWWFSVPAILKGWIDRVFAMGFAYDARKSYDTGIFAGKCAMLALTTGSPEGPFSPEGRHAANIHDLLLPVQRGALYFVGMNVLPPFIAYGAARCSPEQRAAYLEAYQNRLLRIENTAPIYAALSAKQSSNQ